MQTDFVAMLQMMHTRTAVLNKSLACACFYRDLRCFFTYVFGIHTNLSVAFQSAFAFLARRVFYLLFSPNRPLMLMSVLRIIHVA